MALSELLLLSAAFLAALSSGIFTFVYLTQRPRYRRGRRSAANVASSSSAPFTHTLSRQDEGSSLQFDSPRTRIAIVDGSVADVKGDLWVGGAEVSFSR